MDIRKIAAGMAVLGALYAASRARKWGGARAQEEQRAQNILRRRFKRRQDQEEPCRLCGKACSERSAAGQITEPGLPEAVRPYVWRELGLDSDSLICAECAEKLQNTLNARRMAAEKVTTYPYTYRGNIHCDRSGGMFIESGKHHQKQDTLQDLKIQAALCGLDVVFDISYRYETVPGGTEKIWTAAGKMAKRKEAPAALEAD